MSHVGVYNVHFGGVDNYYKLVKSSSKLHRALFGY